jgi:hypothetical protein
MVEERVAPEVLVHRAEQALEKQLEPASLARVTLLVHRATLLLNDADFRA